MAADKIVVVRGYRPGALGRIVELHGCYYHDEWGVGAAFEALVAEELLEFHRAYDSDKDLLLLALEQEHVLGSIVVHGSKPDDVAANRARLRWFILDRCVVGRGIGKCLLQEALHFCGERSFDAAYLWTVADLATSRSIYDRFGFVVTHSEIDNRYSRPLTSLRMEVRLRDREARAFGDT